MYERARIVFFIAGCATNYIDAQGGVRAMRESLDYSILIGASIPTFIIFFLFCLKYSRDKVKRKNLLKILALALELCETLCFLFAAYSLKNLSRSIYLSMWISM